PARPAPPARGGDVVSRVAPGPWLRLTALVASAGTLLAVVSGTAHLGATHRLLAALVAPPLAALLVSAWLTHRSLLPAALGATAARLGLALACGGASALNHVLDRDIDPLMGERTKMRPVASGRVAPSRALEFGLALSALSFVLLASTINVLTAVLALVGNLFY